MGNKFWFWLSALFTSTGAKITLALNHYEYDNDGNDKDNQTAQEHPRQFDYKLNR